MKIVTLLIYVIFFILIVIKMKIKRFYYMDEAYSYGLSNHNMIPTFKKNEYESTYDIFYNNYFAVKKNERFDYRKVWKNQKNDVHPPIYYILLHTICSFFPRKFSWWYAGSINIFFSLLTLYFRKIILNLSNNNIEICTIVSLLFIFSPGILSATIFLRMYVIAMFIFNLLIYIIIKEIDISEYNFNFYLKLYFISVFGALTHYYCIFFTILTCFILMIILLIQRRWKAIIKLIITGISGGITACLIFPPMLKHIFRGYRAKDTINNLKQSNHKYWLKLQFFNRMINKDIFANHFTTIVISILISIFINLYLDKKRSKLGFKDYFQQIIYDKSLQNIIIKYIIILFPSLIYFLFIAKTAINWHFRFFTPIYCIIFVGFFNLLILLIVNIFEKKYYYFALIVLILSYIFKNEWIIFWKDVFKPFVPEPIEKYSNLDCIFIYDVEWRILEYIFEIKQCKMIKFVYDKDINSTIFSQENMNQLLLMYYPNIKINLNEFIKFFKKINSYQRIKVRSNLIPYYLYSK